MGRFVALFLIMAFAGACRAMPQLEPLKGLGSSISDVATGSLNGAVGALKTLNDRTKENVKKLDLLFAQVDTKMKEMVESMGSVNIDKITLTKTALATYQTALSDLRDARFSLTKLAHKTVISTDATIDYLAGWDSSIDPEKRKRYLQEQLRIMNDLITESTPILEKAESTYRTVVKKMVKVNLELDGFKLDVAQMLDENSVAHKKWVSDLRASVYAGVALPVAIGMAILDALGCLGICSGIVTSSTVATSAAVIETEIATFTAGLKALEQTVINANDDMHEINSRIKDLKTFVENETNIIIKWGNNLAYVKNQLPGANAEDFNDLPLKRTAFSKSLSRLRDSAQAFLDQGLIFDDGKRMKAQLLDPNSRRKQEIGIKQRNKNEKEFNVVRSA